VIADGNAGTHGVRVKTISLSMLSKVIVRKVFTLTPWEADDPLGGLMKIVVAVLALAFMAVPVAVAQQEIDQMASVWEGVFTEVQANRGQEVYAGACAFCHGRRLNGAPDDPDMRSTPPLARAKFLREWEGRSLAVLFEYTRATMPENNPGSMTDQEYVDVIAYMLSMSMMPAADEELRPDPQSLARSVIQRQP